MEEEETINERSVSDDRSTYYTMDRRHCWIGCTDSWTVVLDRQRGLHQYSHVAWPHRCPRSPGPRGRGGLHKRVEDSGSSCNCVCSPPSCLWLEAGDVAHWQHALADPDCSHAGWHWRTCVDRDNQCPLPAPQAKCITFDPYDPCFRMWSASKQILWFRKRYTSDEKRSCLDSSLPSLP